MNRDDGKHGQDSVWNHPLRTGTVIPDLQLGKVAGGWRHRGCFIDNEGGQQGRLDENVLLSCPGQDGEELDDNNIMGGSVVREAAQEPKVRTMQPLS